MSVHPLSRYLQGLEVFLDEPGVVEISLNPTGDVFVERFGQGSKIEGTMSPALAERFLRYCAAANELSVDALNPILSTRVPGTQHRIEGILPPVVRATSFSIRLHAARTIPLEEFVGNAEVYQVLCSSIEARHNIVVAGSTGSGKTTFVNSCLQTLSEVDSSARLLVLEDTEELRPVNANTLLMLSSPAITLDRLLVSSLRLSPDRIVVGEVRTGAVLMTLLKSWNTGHPGGLTTVHANSAEDVLDRFRMLASEVSVSDQSRFIGGAVDTIVFLKRDIGAPEVRQILQVHSSQSMETLYEDL